MTAATSRARTFLVAALGLALLAIEATISLELQGPAKVGLLGILCALGCALVIGASSRRARSTFIWIVVAAVFAAPYVTVILTDERWRSR